jgi:hypothetical protein
MKIALSTRNILSLKYKKKKVFYEKYVKLKFYITYLGGVSERVNVALGQLSKCSAISWREQFNFHKMMMMSALYRPTRLV